jgi:hypothetical protein
MTRVRQSIFALAAALAVVTTNAQPTAPVPPKISGNNANLTPPTLPPRQPPVTFFRQLLAMSVTERNQSLTNRTPETRARILAKVHEYQVLGADERELRLRATELRWWLTPLLRTSSPERDAQLAKVPADLQELVKSRLAQWNLLPPPLQAELLANDKTLHYFARVEPTNAVVATEEQQKISEQFNQFFELTAEEKAQTLNTLSEAERNQMENTLQSFEKLPPQQRKQCVKNYTKFAGMTATERTEFLKSAEKWSSMTPKERQTWRDLVTHIPQWPPMPPTIVPPNLLPPLPKAVRASVATNP